MKNSFSLIEVLVFVTILSFFFVMAASVTTVTLRSMKYNEHKIFAVHYASQLAEWLKAQKEIDWGGNYCSGSCCAPSCSFTQRITQGTSPYRFCFKDVPITNWPSPGACGASDLIDSLYQRQVEFTPNAIAGYINQVNVNITVSWQELGQSYIIPIRTVLTVYE